LWTYFAKAWKYPFPEQSIEIRSGATVLRYQGELGFKNLSQIEADDWKDPTSNSYFTYSINGASNQYQVAGYFETTLSFNMLWIQKANAYFQNGNIKLFWKPLWIILDSTGVPANEVSSLRSAGFLDLSGNTTSYTAKMNNTWEITNQWSLLIPTLSALNLNSAKTYKTCKELKDANKSQGDGIYLVNPSSTVSLLPVYCDMKNTTQWPYPKPTFGIDFVQGKATINNVDTSINSLLSVTRSGVSTYQDATWNVKSVPANTLRYGTNGLLIEESRTNECLYSENLGHVLWTWYGWWTLTRTTWILAPDGSYNWWEVTSNQSGILEYLWWTWSGDATASIWAKTPSGSANVTVYAQGNDNLSWKTTSVGTSWTRITSNGTGTTGKLKYIIISWPTGTPLHLWGAQIEQWGFATSYIPTSSATVTRNADYVTLNSGSGWYQNGIWSMLVETWILAGYKHAQFIVWKNIPAGTEVSVYMSSPWSGVGISNWTYRVDPPWAFSLNGWATALSRNGSNMSMTVNGWSITTNSNGIMIDYFPWVLGSYRWSTHFLQWYIKRLTYWWNVVSNSDLQSMTAQ
jgi:hypothetical protein